MDFTVDKIFPKNWKYLKFHLVFWAIYIVYEVSLSSVVSGKFGNVWDYLLHYCLDIGLFYFHSHFVLKEYHSGKWMIPFWIITEFFLCIFFNFLILTLLPRLGITLAYNHLNSFFILATGYRLAFILLISTAYWYMLQRIKSLKKIHQQKTLIFKTKLKNKQLKNSMLEEQLSKQKASIVPHFLFNTLHVLYHQLRKEKPQEAQHLLSLSEMMHYNLSPLDQQYKIPLSHELSYLKNYVDLRQLERKYAIKLMINVSDEAADELQIIPLVMATLIENVFHHGDLYQPSNPALIVIGLNKNHFHIWIKNEMKINSTPKNGIGIANMQARLAHFYPEQHQYISYTSKNQYIQKLFIYL